VQQEKRADGFYFQSSPLPDTHTGEIAHLDAFKEMFPVLTEQEFDQRFHAIDAGNLSPAMRETLGRTGTAMIGRNSSCPCGSGKKFKRCCMDQSPVRLF
jgi:uncharacterized protein YecA (UPF0149 family)